MPRGKFVNHKGRSRHFTSSEELKKDLKDDDDHTSSEEGSETASTSKPKAKLSYESSESDDDDDDMLRENRVAKKGVAALIDIENPNRVTRKVTQKLAHIKLDDSIPDGPTSSSISSRPELSRRQREQIENQKARDRYDKLHAAGKTAEAKADLARLAIVRRQRQEAAAKREAAKKGTDSAKKQG